MTENKEKLEEAYDLEYDTIREGGQKIENYFSEYCFEYANVIPVLPDEVTQRTGIGFDAEKVLKENEIMYEVYYRVEINSVDKDEIFENGGVMTSYFREQLSHMEEKTNAPDSVFVADDPPRGKYSSLVFYVRSVL